MTKGARTYRQAHEYSKLGVSLAYQKDILITACVFPRTCVLIVVDLETKPFEECGSVSPYLDTFLADAAREHNTVERWLRCIQNLGGRTEDLDDV